MNTQPVELATGTPRRVLLGVTGGIAAYKTPEIVRRLVEQGIEVQVVMSAGASRFVTATTLQAVCGRPVRDDLWDPAAEAAMGHIELARWAERIVVAPATAHFIAQLAHGLCGDLLTTLCTASTAPLAIAPAMNQVMWTNQAVQDNVATLTRRGIELLGPASGAQACGDTGMGRMLEPDEIVAAICRPQDRPLLGLRVLLTAGPTREPLDPVRYLTNRSSGKMGFALARAFRRLGAEVVLISGPVELDSPACITRIDVESAEQMHNAVHAEIAGTDIFIGCAAVADFRPARTADRKIKRSDGELKVEFERAPDVLASVASLASAPFTVGFAAETNDVRSHALRKLESKKIDMIAANEVGPDLGFDADNNALQVFWRGGEVEFPLTKKSVLAEQLARLVGERFRAVVSANATRAG